MRTIDRVLELIREHPEGITTLEIAEIIYYGERVQTTITANIYTKAAKLRKYGLVSLTHEMRPNVIGQIVNTAVWRPIQ